ncbi:uncharacterized protein LOC110834592 isoform X2 [Zootermopsis nevadensis]|uniref:uncharacterized protein LOC110834592 isoform X2 n=1 Tax=Zootermopsis nevadensis TaxID=136037 RepID=UPI000B8E58BD|nr:uncharacterized protein LOC110834592 isoform X2 [Zootermopsis nevadensis]
MWFCCQIWQCSFETCLKPLEIWKTWNGWSHVVYPSKGKASSKTFEESRGGRSGDQATLKEADRGNPSRDIPSDPIFKDVCLPLDLASEKPEVGDLQENLRSLDSSAQIPYRTPSTDLTELEQSLDYWHRQHSRQRYGCPKHVEDESHSKVRYNDTGSLEEVNREEQVDYIVQSGKESRYFSYGQSAQYEYRKLWSLRATLAESEHLSEQRVNNKETVTLTPGRVKHSQSSVEIYPGRAVEARAGRSLDSATVGYTNEEISHQTRRQMYINAANSRMKCTVRSVCQCESLSLNSSRESIDTIDNEHYSTDTSFVDQPTNYGIDGSSVDRQERRLEQLRADSGYRSMENPPATNLGTHQQSFDTTGRPPHHIPIDYHIEMPVCYNTSRDSQGSAADLSTKRRDSFKSVNRSMSAGYNTAMVQYCHEVDEGVAELQSPLGPNISFGSWERCQRKNYHSASRRRREFGFGGGRHALAHVAESKYSRSQIFQTVGAGYTRDYSVDQKSDALFREFSRCDPVKTRASGVHRQQFIHSLPYPVRDHIKELSQPQDSDEGLLALDMTKKESDDLLTTLDSDHCEDNYDSSDSDEDDDSD